MNSLHDEVIKYGRYRSTSAILRSEYWTFRFTDVMQQDIIRVASLIRFITDFVVWKTIPDGNRVDDTLVIFHFFEPNSYSYILRKLTEVSQRLGYLLPSISLLENGDELQLSQSMISQPSVYTILKNEVVDSDSFQKRSRSSIVDSSDDFVPKVVDISSCYQHQIAKYKDVFDKYGRVDKEFRMTFGQFCNLMEFWLRENSDCSS